MSNDVDARLVKTGRRIRVRGTVQGVGFRPNIYRLANQFGVDGQVLNDGEGVLIEAWGKDSALSAFIDAITEQKPPLSHIASIEQSEIFDDSVPAPEGFRIVRSQSTCVQTNISADAATCPDCIKEVHDPFNRRFRYPFTNCTNCGPRLSIIKNLPYDRPFTSMAMFPLCQDCSQEYNDPESRRFHAQANACHACGPRARLARMDGRVFSIEGLTQLDDVDACATLLKRGEIVAIKGIGGYHLAADAANEQTVARLREAKQRYHKPFALMARDLEVIRRYCHVTDSEAALLNSSQSPIVLLEKNDGEKLAASVAPNQKSLGFMLPYTALHHLLLMRMDSPIVLTSGNLSDEPQCIEDADAKERLGQLADYVLLHDREIVNRLDDSVVRLIGAETQILRRSRGYAPEPIELPEGFEKADRILAMGGQLKNTFCLVSGGKAIVCQHLGDLEEARAYSDYEHNLALYKNLFAFQPENIVIDLHPDYLSSKLGRQLSAQQNLPLLEVQHHHAHIASVMAENAWPLKGGSLLGIALDGLGLGADGTLWGGEFLRADYLSCERLGTFKPVPLLGASRAMHEPWRNTYAHIMAEMGWSRYKIEYDNIELTRFLEEQPLKTFNAMLSTGRNSPSCTSAGRLFDAVAAAVGICRDRVTYEGQAAIEFENAVDVKALENEADCPGYPFTMPRLGGKGLPYIEPLAMWHAVFADLLDGLPQGVIAARFHKGLAGAIAQMAIKLATQEGVVWTDTVALSGGVFQNKILLSLLRIRLEAEGFRVLVHARMPANDGGLSLGQAAIGAALVLPGKGA